MQDGGSMKPEQRVVVGWMRRVLMLRGWTPEEWARRARVSPTTITRAMRDSYDGVTSLTVLHKLASVSGLASPLAVLQKDCVVVRIPKRAEELAELGYADADEATKAAAAERIRAILDLDKQA